MGQDTHSYMVIYNDLRSISDLIFHLNRLEPLPVLLMYAHKAIINNYTNLLFLVSVCQVYLLAYATRNMHHRALFLVFYFAVFYFHDNLAALRVGLALSFMLAAFSDVEDSPQKAFCFLVFALFSHVTVLILFPVLLIKRGVSARSLMMASIASGFILSLFILYFSDYIFSKAVGYGVFELGQLEVPKLSLALMVMLFISFLLTRSVRLALGFSAFILFFFLMLSASLEIAYRLYNISLLAFSFLCFERRCWGGGSFKPYFAATVIILSWFSYSNFHYLYTEHEKWSVGTKKQRDFAYTPYTLFFQSEYRYE